MLQSARTIILRARSEIRRARARDRLRIGCRYIIIYTYTYTLGPNRSHDAARRIALTAAAAARNGNDIVSAVNPVRTAASVAVVVVEAVEAASGGTEKSER